MNRRSIQSVCPLAVIVAVLAWPHASRAQADPPTPAPAHQHETPADPHAGHLMAGSLFTGRDNAGTAWTPARTPMLAAHRQAGPWSLMLMGNGFVQYLEEFAPIHRGGRQAGSVNWMMGMGRRPLGAGVVGARVMLSAEPFTVRGCGYPNLLASGELCDADGIHDKQHPHDLMMELAAEYSRPITRSLRWHVYGGPVGEPALGPVAFPHRASAVANPIAPISHHWLDATHITYGVVTTGLTADRWRLEGSVFNGREPDDQRHDFDFAPLDSFSVRLQLAPTDGLTLQVSGGRLESAEAGEGSLPPRDVGRITASMQYQGALAGRALAATVAWGSNDEVQTRTHAALAEGVLTLTPRHAVFARAEIAGKRGHDLHIHEDVLEIFTVGKLQGGYLRLFTPRRGVQAGIGGSVSAAIVPEAIQPNYGGVGLGLGIFATLRPAAR
jgi:hypothetical protein